MAIIWVDEFEFTTLRDYKSKAPTARMRLRSEAIMLASRGIPDEVIAEMVDRQLSTIAQWKREFQQSRLASIRDNNLGNRNAAKLTVAQWDEAIEVLSQPPDPALVPEGFWTVPALANWLFDRFEVTYASDTSLVLLLHQAGLSFHQPEAFDQRRADDAAIAARMEEIRQEIAAGLIDPDVIVVAADEVRIEHEALIRRAWYTQGAKTKLEVDRQRQAQNYLGFLDQNSGSVNLQRLDWQNSDTIVEALDTLTLTHPGKRITIVWDNASWHKSKTLREALTQHQNLGRVHLINMPPYAPDHNPIEHVWGEAKTRIANFQRESFDATRNAFETFVQGNRFPYRL